MRRRLPLGFALFVTLSVGATRAEPAVTIDASRIVAGDVAPLEDGFDVELGPAPPPGGSRLVERREVLSRLREAGADTAKVSMPASVRVVRASRKMTATELSAEAEPLLRAALPAGVTLSSLRFARGLVLPPHAAMKRAPLPKLPHRAGTLRTTVTFELVENDEVVGRAPGTVTLEISARAAEPSVTRGSRLDIVIVKGPARVGAVGSALADGDVGDVIPVRIDSTQKVLEARLESKERAVVARP